MPRWDEGRWDEGHWDDSLISNAANPPKKRRIMKRQKYFPSRIADQVLWLINYLNKLPGYATALGLASGDLAAALADAKWVVYVLGTWLPTVRAFAPSTTDAVDNVLEGTGDEVAVLPTFTAPALPTGVVAVLPGALTRLFKTVALLKDAPGYLETIGTDLGFEGPEDTMSKALKFTTRAGARDGKYAGGEADFLQIRAHGGLYREPARARAGGNS